MPARFPRSATPLTVVIGLIAGGVAAVVLAPAAQADPALPTPNCSAATTCTITYGYTGAAQTFTVPTGVSALTTTVNGAAGGDDYRAGRGGTTTATLPVSAGDVLTVVAGQQGSVDDTTGTFGGGGPVTRSAAGSTSSSGGGGSFVFEGGSLALAAGGGGGYANLGDKAVGGAGGGAAGSDGAGYPDPGFYFYTGASGATQSAGGAGGSFSVFTPSYDYGATHGTNGSGPASAPDSLGTGGTGGHDTYTSGTSPNGTVYPQGGGGGGGGYYGGGAGGFYQGGGGGSGYLAPGLEGTTTPGTTATSGSVSFTWNRLATTSSLTLSTVHAVHGQKVTATARVTGTDSGTVEFFVDGTKYESRSLVVDRAVSTLPSGLGVGDHDVTARFTPSQVERYAGSMTSDSTLTVNPAATTTTVKVRAASLVATVAVQAPSTDLPDGSVTFFVHGKKVGSAALVDGVATLQHATASGIAVTAVYSGRIGSNATTEIGSSSASTARTNPVVMVAQKSSKGVSKAGWYSAPVTLSFSCAAGSDAVTTCPKPVAVSRDGVTTVSRTVIAKDGGAATANVTIKIDRHRPTVRISGVKPGRTYPGALPRTRCMATDRVSGVGSCRIDRKVHGIRVTYTAIAIDRAGNTTSSTIAVRRSPVFISGADYSGIYPTVKLGNGYALIVTSTSRPKYVWAAPAPVRPEGDGGQFIKLGKNRWSYSVVFTKNLRGHSQWNFGVTIGRKTLVVKVNVKR